MLKTFFLLCFFAAFHSLSAQNFTKYSEIGLMGGVSYYVGDLNPSRQFFMPRLSGGIIFRYSPNRRFTWRIHGLIGSIQADDANSNNEFQISRNLSFRSQIIEAAGILEFNFFNYEVGNPTTPATPFIFGGIAMFRYNPKAELDGQWIALQPIGTEGQGSAVYAARKPYSLITGSFPFGIGLKAHAFGRLALSAEWGMRRSFSDYIDDVSTTYADPDVVFAANGPVGTQLADRSLVNAGKANTGRQRGNPETRDWYSFAGLTITYKLVPKKADCAAYN
jgi:hypothetical protein